MIRMRYGTNSKGWKQKDRNMSHIGIMIDGKFCMAFALAVLALSGCSSIRQLSDKRLGIGLQSYAAKDATEGKLISVDYVPPQYCLAPLAVSPSRIIETNILCATVTAKNSLGTIDNLGWFDIGKIVEREFDKVVKWNFALPPVVVPSTAEFSFSVGRVSLVKEMDDVISSLEISVKISRVGHSDEVAYNKWFSSTKRGQWEDDSAVPESFYAALNEIVKSFLDDWSRSRAMLTLKTWVREPCDSDLSKPIAMLRKPEIVLPPLKVQNGVCCGSCEVVCNDYDEPMASAYAFSYIDQQCRKALGIEPERVRIVYDVMEMKDGHGRYEFRAFARSKEPVLTFDGRKGSMTGDLALMGMTSEEAMNEMQRRIQDAMDKVISTGNGVRSSARVHFDPPATMGDGVYGLLTVPFWLGGL